MIEPDYSSYCFLFSEQRKVYSLVFVTLRVSKNVNIFESAAHIKQYSILYRWIYTGFVKT